MPHKRKICLYRCFVVYIQFLPIQVVVMSRVSSASFTPFVRSFRFRRCVYSFLASGSGRIPSASSLLRASSRAQVWMLRDRQCAFRLRCVYLSTDPTPRLVHSSPIPTPTSPRQFSRATIPAPSLSSQCYTYLVSGLNAYAMTASTIDPHMP
jgi:hypothetical protein